MSINVILTPEDMLGNDLQPGWYPLEITKVDEAPTKAGDSNNTIFFFKIILEGKFKGRELRRYFNEKVMFFGNDLWISLGFIDPKKGGSLSSELLKTAEGKKVMGFIKKDENGKFDVIDQFKPFV